MIQTRQWDVLDIRFRASKMPKTPVDIDFSATFDNDSGESLTVAGFYNGQDEYLIRFTPPSPGTWNYATKSSLTVLNGRTGVLSVERARDGRKGGIVVDSEKPTRFRYENGESYYPIAFESDWLFALNAENADDIPVTRKFVDKLAENGFNQIVMNVFAYDVNWKKDDQLPAQYEYGSPKVFPFGGSNAQPDHAKLNVEYFKRLDRVIEYLEVKLQFQPSSVRQW